MKTTAFIALAAFIVSGILLGTTVFGWITGGVLVLVILSMSRVIYLRWQGIKNHNLEVLVVSSLVILALLLMGAYWGNP